MQAWQGINPFKPTSWPQLDVNVGTFWGLLVLSLAYVHHSTAGCALPHQRPAVRLAARGVRALLKHCSRMLLSRTASPGAPVAGLRPLKVFRTCACQQAVAQGAPPPDAQAVLCRFALPALLPLITPDLNLTDHEGALLTVGYTVRSHTAAQLICHACLAARRSHVMSLTSCLLPCRSCMRLPSCRLASWQTAQTGRACWRAAWLCGASSPWQHPR